jgi:hypothetical protein
LAFRAQPKNNAGPRCQITGLRLEDVADRSISRLFPLSRARPAAAAGVAEADVAAAAALAARFQAIAAGLQHVAALAVAARAGDAAAVFCVFALAVAAAQVEVADLNAVPGAVARAGAVAQGLTKALQGRAGDRVVAAALDAKSTFALLELQLAPRHHAHILRGCGSGCVPRKGWRRSGGESTPTFHNRAGHKQHSFDERVHPGSPADATGLVHPNP